MKFKELVKKIFIYTPPAEYIEPTPAESDRNVFYDAREHQPPPPPIAVSADIDENLHTVTEKFSYPANNDVVIKHFTICGDRKCFLVYYDGMVDGEAINAYIIKGLLELPYIENTPSENLARTVCEKFIIYSQVDMTDSADKVIEEVNFGSCGLFIDGLNHAFALDVKGWEHRSIDKPENEQSIYGPQEAFAEMLRTNTILIRKILKTERLVAKGIKVGNVSKTRGVTLYLSDIANPTLVDEVQHRLNSISIDFVISVEEVAQLIETPSYLGISQIMSTERPDRAARALTEGRVVFLLNGSPRALIFPTNFLELTHAASDAFLCPPYANMSRVIRFAGMFVSVFLPALYLAITLFHQEMLPTYLLYAISAARANVPFPSVVELLLMDFSFEMIREAGIRMPGPIGQTLGIVGGLILGQSAVSAKIVSPMMSVIIAITGIGSFSTSDYSLSWTFRLMRIIFILLAAAAGFFGIAIGIFAYLTYMATLSSFGIPFLAPLPGSSDNGFFGTMFVKRLWKAEKRPSYLHPEKPRREPKISRHWFIK